MNNAIKAINLFLSLLEGLLSLDTFRHTLFGIVVLLISCWDRRGRSLHFLIALEVLDTRPSVNCWFILDFLCFRAISECTQTFMLILAMWWHRHDHAGSWVSTKGISKYSGQLWFTVGKMVGVRVVQGVDKTAQSGQTLIDTFSFIKDLAMCERFCDSFWSGQVNQLQLANLTGTLGLICHYNLNCHNCVTPRTPLIHSIVFNSFVLVRDVD